MKKVPNPWGLTWDDVPPGLSWLEGIISFDALLKIVDDAGGEMLYIPKRETLEQPYVRKAICQDFNGYNVKEISRKYNRTSRRVRGILQEEGLLKPVQKVKGERYADNYSISGEE